MNLNINGSVPDPENEQLKKTQPMKIILDICRLMGNTIRQKGEVNPIGQKSGQLLMIELAKKDGRTQLDLVKATNLKAPTISVALQKLEHDGYVIRQPDEYDLRAMRVFLTEKGRDLEKRILNKVVTQESIATSVLTEEECETLVHLLTKIRNNLLANIDKGEEL